MVHARDGLVDQPTKKPTRKVSFATVAGALAGIVVEVLHQIPALASYSADWWSQITAVIAFGLTYYFTRERTS